MQATEHTTIPQPTDPKPDDPSFTPSLFGIVVVCRACGAAVFDHPNSINHHVLWHRHIAHIAAVSDTSYTPFARQVGAHVGGLIEEVTR